MDEFNNTQLKDRADAELIQRDICPVCLGELDTGLECNSCGFDAMPLAKKMLPEWRDA